MSKPRILKVANLSLNAIQENKILTKIFEFTVNGIVCVCFMSQSAIFHFLRAEPVLCRG